MYSIFGGDGDWAGWVNLLVNCKRKLLTSLKYHEEIIIATGIYI